MNASVDVLDGDPDDQVAQTIAIMRRYVDEDWDSPEIIKDAAEALAQFGDLDGTEHDRIQAVYHYVRGKVRFRTDEDTARHVPTRDGDDVVEVLIRPRDLSVMCDGRNCERSGDCDDYSMYAAALLRQLGIQSAFVTVAANPATDQYSHVYLAAYTADGQRVPLDTSHGQYPGWETDKVTRRDEWPVTRSAVLPLIIALGLAWLLFADKIRRLM